MATVGCANLLQLSGPIFTLKLQKSILEIDLRICKLHLRDLISLQKDLCEYIKAEVCVGKPVTTREAEFPI